MGFWRDLFDSEDGRDFQHLHPGIRNRTPEDLRTSIPTVIHEDAAPYGKKRSVNVLQWGPLFVNGSDIESRFIHHGYIAKQAEPAEIGRPPWEKFWEEVEYIVGGRDRNGTPIAKDDDGTMWKFVFLFCENDFDMDAEHGLPNSKRAYLFCKHCLATNITKRGAINPHPYNDGGPNASWRNHLVTSNTEFMHRIVRRHPLTDSKYFNRYTCRNDLMHGMDHKGVYGVIFASVVLHLIYNDGEPTLGATQPERLNTVNHRLDKFYIEGGVSNRLDQLEMKNLSSDGPANMRVSVAPQSKPQTHGMRCHF